jgi:L-ascorbate metabolism protein UlaG (beta-lactamase superfamily)
MPPSSISAGVRFPVTGRVRYTMTAKDAVELCALVQPRTAIPIHYEGWKHSREGREAIEREFAKAPEDIRGRRRWLSISAESDANPARQQPAQNGRHANRQPLGS